MELPLGAYAACLNGFSVRNSIGYTVGNDLVHDVGLNSVDPLKIISSLRYDAPNNRWGTELVGTYVDRKHRVDFLTSPDQFVPGPCEAVISSARSSGWMNEGGGGGPQL